jgi:ABC-type sugar transport system ATPase subunit
MNGLQLDKISKRFPGNLALNEATLTVQPGEVHALMGANGAGKSTLMNILGGLLAKDSGQILLEGKEIEIRTAAEAAILKIAFVHQELNMLLTMSVAENVLSVRCRAGREHRLGYLIEQKRFPAPARFCNAWAVNSPPMN